MADNKLGQGFSEKLKLLMERSRSPQSTPLLEQQESQDPMASEAMSLLDSSHPEAGSFQEMLQNKLREIAARRIAGN